MDLLSVLMWIIPTCLVLWITRRYLTATDDVWKQQGIPTVSIWRFIYTFLEFTVNPAHVLILKTYQRYGKLYGSYLFGTRTLSVSHPDLIREILVKNFHRFVNRANSESGDPIIDNMVSLLKGEKWKRMRTVISPTFSTGKIKKMTNTILECADTLRKNFEKAAESNEPIDIKTLIGAFTMDTIASTAFSTKVDSHNDANNPFVVAAGRFSNRAIQWKTMILFMFNRLFRLLGIKTDLMPDHFFEDIAAQIIAERRKSKETTRVDFMQLMLNASEKHTDTFATKVAADDVGNAETNGKRSSSSSEDINIDEKVKDYEGLTDEEIISQCVVFFVGGFETVASTISFALYELVLNEDCQEALIAEVDRVLTQNKNELTYEDVQEMKYLDCVVSETLRKYPVGLILQRMALSDCTIGDRNIRIPKDTTIAIPVYALHYDPEYYPDPENFDPERFSPEEKASRDPYVYLPFGAGPRNCIAMRFALMEVKLCLAHLLRHFRFRKCSATQVPLKYGIGQLQLNAKDIFVTVHKRKDAIVCTKVESS